MTLLWTLIAALALLEGAPPADEPMSEGERQLADQIRYLTHIERAADRLEDKDASGAIRELEQALEIDVADCRIPFMELHTKGAAAHYLLACAHSAEGRLDAALASLRAAAENGYRNTSLVKSDERIAALRKHAGFAEVLALFPDENPTDEFAGKTVADREFGMAMQMKRKGNFPKVGEIAPDFELATLDGDGKTLRLSDYRGKKPVVLVFGSFT